MSCSYCRRLLITVIILGLVFVAPAFGQQSQGGITGTVSDSTGAVVTGVKVNLSGIDTGLEQSTVTNSVGSYQFSVVPIGRYSVTFAKKGFTTQVHSPILVQAQRTTTVNGKLQAGEISTKVTVSGTPLLDKVDITNGYILGSSVIKAIPLGTGSFTQLAVLSPGVSADLLSGSGTNAGLGNLNIWANGQRDTSNSFSFNGINSNNIFNGKSSSSVSENRWDLNTGESFLAGGQIATNTSVYDAIGQGLPTPPPETIQELRVDTSMYDASEGQNSGAHVELVTKSGTNRFHGTAYDYVQNNLFNAAPFFFNADPAIPNGQKVPALHRNTFGVTLGGPIRKNKLFFFTSYQGVRDHDLLDATSNATVPLNLTNDRSASALASEFGVPASQISPAALKILNYKLSNGQYLIPTPQITNPQTAAALGYDVVLQGAPSTFTADQANANLNYNVTQMDRLAFKYYYQRDPTSNPFAVSNLEGFPQTLHAGSQVASLENTSILSPSVTWEQKIGFTRQVAFANTGQPLTPQDAGINLFGSNLFPGLYINTADPTIGQGLAIGPSSNFSNAGVFQNQFSGTTDVNWVHGRNNLSFGFEADRIQLNVINKNNQVASLTFNDFPSFLTGQLRLGEENSVLFSGSSNRYYLANQLGAYGQDNIKVTPRLTLDLGLRWDFNGPLVEEHGLLTNFYPSRYQYNAATDTVTNSGLVLAGNSPFHTPGISNSTLFNHQFGFAPRVGFAWNPARLRKLVIRGGYGIFYDRGEFFSEFSPSAGFGFNGPFGVTLEPPFIQPVLATSSGNLSNPFGTTAPAPPTGNPSGFTIPNMAALENGATPFLFGGYDPANKLPYSENWELDLQWQATNNLMLTLGYLGNHGQHQLLPIPFNQPLIATPQHPVHGQIYSYGYQPCFEPGSATAGYCGSGNYAPLPTEPFNTSTGGNTDLRVPYIGYSPNSVFYQAEGVSNYDALQFSVTKRLSHGLQINGSYTYSHTLDEGSGLQLFYNGNNPLNPRSAYGNAGFDRTHVLAISYMYDLPKAVSNSQSIFGRMLDNWSVSGINFFESGMPYSVYDYSGSIGSLFYSANDYITNPIIPTASGKTYSGVQLQGTTNVNAGQPVLSTSGFALPLLQPGQDGVPPCSVSGGVQQCDTFESGYGAGGRNVFRSPFQPQINLSVMKNFKLTERFALNFRADFFNLLNQASFDAPNNNATFNPCYNPLPCYTYPPQGSLGMIQHTIGSPRFVQLALHLDW